MVPAAAQYQEVAQAGVGTIVAAVGLQSVATGDTLVDASGQEVVQLEGVALPVPVFTCAVEPETLASAKDLEEALRTLQLEDPSFHVEQDQESGTCLPSRSRSCAPCMRCSRLTALSAGQTLLSGMGELHMEILAHRLREHYRVAARLGPMRISYRCTVAQARRLRHEHEDRKGRASLEVEVEPAPRGTGNSLTWSEEALAALPAGAYGAELRAAVEEGVGFGWARGAQLSVPLQDVAVRIHYAGVGAQDQASLASARAAASQAVVLACRDASPTLLEPVMRLEIEVSEEHLSGVLADLAHRQAMVLGVENLASGRRELRAEAPLRQLRGYSTTIRSLTQGTATLSMEFVRNQEVAQVALADVMKELRGF
jgi:elongation factor G